jgi:hypothetical protein
MIVEEFGQEPETSAPDGATVWHDTLAAYGNALDAQRTYLDAVSSGAPDAEPPAPFTVPAGLPALPDELRDLVATLHAETLMTLAQHAALPDRLAPTRVGLAIARRTTTTTVSVLDRAL